MSSPPRPNALSLDQDGSLLINWNDGERRRYRVAQLRDHCPCATCREKRTASPETQSLLPVLSPEETLPLSIAGMTPVGAYAYNIQFSDGHDSGIFTLEHLRTLGDRTEES